MNYDIAFYEVFAEEQERLVQFLPDGYAYYFTENTIQEEDSSTLLAPLISIRTQSIIPTGWARFLDGIFTRSTGYDHIHAYLTQTGLSLSCGYLPKYAATAVAEQTLMLMLMLLRNANKQQTSMETFSRNGLTGYELRQTCLAIIGVGNIGSEMARIGHGLGMQLLGVDLEPREQITAKYHLKYVSLSTAIQSADIISCHLSLTNFTAGMLDYEVLSQAKSSAIFLNTARGEIAPPHDLITLLREEKLSGIGLDVYDAESLVGSYLRGKIEVNSITSPEKRQSLEDTLSLLKHPRVIATPHNAFNTAESTSRKAQQTAENVAHFLSEQSFLTPVPPNPTE